MFSQFLTVCNWYRSGDKKTVRKEVKTLLMTCKQIKLFEIELEL